MALPGEENINNILKHNIDRYLSSRSKETRRKITEEIISSLERIPESFTIDKNLSSQLEVVVRDIWEKLDIHDSAAIRNFYRVDMENRTFQILYTKALVMGGNSAEIMAFLKGKSIIANIPQVVENVMEMGKITSQWDFIVMFLSMNGIYNETAYLKYSENASKLITDIIIENLKRKNSNKETMEFLSAISAVDNSLEYRIAYLEALKDNNDIPSLKSHLKTMDLNRVEDLEDRVKLALLFEKVGLYDESLNLATEVLNQRPGHEVCLELKIKSLFELGRDEEVIDLFLDRHSILEKNAESMETFFRAAENVNNYGVAISVIDSNRQLIERHQNLIVWAVKFLVKGKKIDDAEKLMQGLQGSTMSDSEMLKLSSLIEKGKGNIDSFVEKSERYLLENPHDMQFISTYIAELHRKGMYHKIAMIYESSEEDRFDNEPETLKKVMESMLRMKVYEKAGQILGRIPAENLDSEIAIAILETARDDTSFSQLQKYSGKKNTDPFMCLLRDILYTDTITASDVGFVKENMNDQNGRTMLYLFAKKREFEQITAIEMSPTINEIRMEIEKNNPGKDWRQFNFPVIRAKIRSGEFSAVGKILSMMDSDADPYLLCYRSLYEKHFGNNTNSRYSIEKAMEKIRATPFLEAYLQINPNITSQQALRIIEEISKLRGLEDFDFTPVESVFISNSDMDVTANLLDLLEYSGVENIFALRLMRQIKIRDNDIEGAIGIDQKIISNEVAKAQDILNYARDLKQGNRMPEMEILVKNSEGKNIDMETSLIFGDFYLSKRDFTSAIYYYEKAAGQGKKREDIPGLIEALIRDSKYDVATELIEKLPNKTPYLINLYAATENVQEISKTMKKLNLKKEEDRDALTIVVERYWSNKILRENAIEKIMVQPVQNPGISIVEKLFGDRRADIAIQLLRKISKESRDSPEVISLMIRILPDMGKIEELNEYLTKFFNSRKALKDKRKVFHEACLELEKSRMYDIILKHYQDHPNLLDNVSAGVIVYSMIERRYFTHAENLLAKLQGTLIKGDEYEKLNSILKKSIYLDKIINYAGIVLKRSYNLGRRMDKGEIISTTKTDPIMVDDIMEFLSNPPDTHLYPVEYLERVSYELLKIINRKLGINRIEEIDIFHLFFASNFKDVRLSVALYYYIRDLSKQQKDRLMVDTKEILDLANRCIMENLPENPMIYSIMFDIGIGKAYRVYAKAREIKQVNRGPGWRY